MIIDAYATDTTPSHEVRRRALEALANEGEPMSEVTYDAFRKRVKELETALKQARLDALEEAEAAVAKSIQRSQAIAAIHELRRKQ